jgi:hypothetical protein
MGSKKDMPVKLHPLFAATFNQVFGEPTTKKDTKGEDRPTGEGRKKGKKRGDDE